MAHKTFVDADGVTWQVWEVHPTTIERRLGDRRTTAGPFAGAERRRGERRSQDERRIFLGPELSQGWLAFHSARERRRYAPIPEGWTTMTAAELSALCNRAKPVPGATRSRRGNGGMKQTA
jgi:hypothetical protein